MGSGSKILIQTKLHRIDKLNDLQNQNQKEQTG